MLASNGNGVEQSTYWIHVAWNYPHEMWNISFTLTDLKRYIKEYELNQENLRILHCYIVICLDLTSVQSTILFYIYIINMNSYANLLFQSFICANRIDIIFCSIYLFSLLFYRKHAEKCWASYGTRDVQVDKILFYFSVSSSEFVFVSQCTLIETEIPN